MAKVKRKWEPDPSYVPKDHYQALTNTIVAALEGGTVPWRKPWDPEKTAGPQAPMNPTTGKRYHGVNTFILGMDPRAFASGDPRWCSFNQARDKGWMVKKGEKATTVFFYKKLVVDDPAANDADGKKTIPMLKSYSVFHASQIDGIPAYKPPGVGEAPWLRPEAASTILKNSGADVRVGGERAFYSPSTDHIQLPPDRAFETPAGWASTALHELGHWTGHKDRLDRDMTARFGSGGYAQEELRAELASVFIGSEVGIPSDIPGHASYVASWLNALKNDKKEIFRAAADAQRMADHCLAFHPEWKAARDAEMKAEAVEAEPEAASEAKQTAVPAPGHTMPDVLGTAPARVAVRAAMEERPPTSSLGSTSRSVPIPDFASVLSGEVEPAPAPSYGPRR